MSVLKELTKEEFRTGAPTIRIVGTAGDPVLFSMSVPARQWRTGRVGWSGCQEVHIEVDGRRVRCRVRVEITAITSKVWPES